MPIRAAVSSESAHGHIATSGIGGLARTVKLAVQSKVDVMVEESVGDYGFSREVFFGDTDGRGIYTEYAKSDRLFMRRLKQLIKSKTEARNIFITKADSLFHAEDEIARLSIRFTGALNAEYIAVAFDGAGFVDRRGKDGGHKNWSLRGFFRQKDMYAEFLNAATAESENVVDSCDATLH